MKKLEYDREKSVNYAKKWANSYNPNYYNFNFIGGDCTNFVSQCLYEGGNVMNYTKDIGWYYISLNNRSASWSSVEYFYKFLIENGKNILNNDLNNSNMVGPYAIEASLEQCQIGDFIQLGHLNGDFYHNLIISGYKDNIPLVCAHSFAALDRPLNTYFYAKIRCIKILGFIDF